MRTMHTAVAALCLLLSTALFGAQSDSVTQHGITWYFSQSHEVGQFATGDWWVVGPVTITAITPDLINAADGDLHNGWEAKLTSTGPQGFDSRAHGFDEAQIPALPYTADGAQSIVKAVSTDTSAASCRPCLRTAAVLTVVDAIPPDSGLTVFRPPYFDLEKVYYDTAAIRMDLLPDFPVLDTSLGVDWQVPRYQRVWLDHRSGWSGASIHPTENMPEYGSNVANRINEGACWLLQGHDPGEKKIGTMHYLQMCLDYFHMLKNGSTWPSNGGHASGRKLPILLAGYLLDHPEMMDSVKNAPYNTFQEDGHLYLSEHANGGAGQVLFGNETNEKGYWRLVVTRVGLGNRTTRDFYGYIDGGHRPGSSYQYCCNSMVWKGAALVLKNIPELQDPWNNTDFLTYVDRWVSHGAWAQPDPCAPPDLRDTLANGDFNSDTLAGSHYGITYGPDPNSPGDCIRDTDSSDGIGRFPDLHGTNTDDGGYQSGYNNALYAAYEDSVYSDIFDGYGSEYLANMGSLLKLLRLPNPAAVGDIKKLGSAVSIYTGSGELLTADMIYETGQYFLKHKQSEQLVSIVILKKN